MPIITNNARLDANLMFLLFAFSIPLFNYIGYNIVCNFFFLVFFVLTINSNTLMVNKFCNFFTLFPLFIILGAIISGTIYNSVPQCYSFFSMLLLMVLMNSVLKRNDIARIEDAIILGSLTLVVLDLSIYSTSSESVYRLGDLTANTNNMGILLAVSSLFIFDRITNYRKYILIVFFFFLEVLILYTQSRSALIFSLLGISIIFISKKGILKRTIKKKFLYFSLLLIFVALLGLQSDFFVQHTERIQAIGDELNNLDRITSVSVRMEFIHAGYIAFFENPLFGHGINTTRVFLQGTYFHNIYIQILYEFGMVGLLLFLLPIVTLLIQGLIKRNSIVIAFSFCILIEGLFDVYYGNKLYYLIFGLSILRLKYSSPKRVLIS